ncbi:glutamine-hydrolyzing GMP synthase, partial [Candidatus Deferrimicrobium sp.]|uniref:glutamine-hydrolyzing GMP synthase n=1 Tax=Candidatus Deferrimicrobium sp. TaxID=3060586 RepID=UPI002ED9352F
MDGKILILDFGSQYTMLIARRVREQCVYSEIHPYNVGTEFVRDFAPAGIILSGGPSSVYDADAPRISRDVLALGIPVLGICYGMQLVADLLGGKVGRSEDREYGVASIRGQWGSPLFLGIEEFRHDMEIPVWMSHGDRIDELPKGFSSIARSVSSPVAAMSNHEGTIFGVQFHPEVVHTPRGTEILANFLFRVCDLSPDWTMHSFIESSVKKIREMTGTDGVVLGLSGGVDSSVAAVLLHRAIGDRLTCIFVDNGVLRKNERERVEETFRDHFQIDLRVIDASRAFLGDLAGVTDPQEKRRRIGHRFITVFKETAAAIGDDVRFLAQGTLYPDVIESGHGHAGTTANIKLHHNVGGLPEDLGFELIEPLRDLFKDEVRKLGGVLGLPDAIIWRHPFPGPGLAVRIVGEVTEARLALLRDCDEILLEEIIANNLY